jgi:competence protein ComEA
LWDNCEEGGIHFEDRETLIFCCVAFWLPGTENSTALHASYHHFVKGDPMKVLNLLLVALVTCTFGLSAMSTTGYAASDQKEATTSADTAKTTKQAGKVKKEIPHEVNINTADKELLVQLPGIGPVTADSILKYRETNGQFASIDELTNVKGIGNKTLAKLKPYLQKL